MELLASSNRGGSVTCLETNLHVGRRCGQAIVRVAVSIVALVATGCASFDGAPRSAIGLADLEHPLDSAPPSEFGVDVVAELLIEPVAVLEGNDLLAHWLSGGDPLQAPSMRDTLFERRWLLAASEEEALAASDDWTRLWALSDADLLTPLSVALDTDSSAADSPWWASASDLQLDSAAVLPRADSQVVAIDEPPSPAPPGALVVPVVVGSTPLTVGSDLWQGVLQATAVGFLAVVLLVPLGCSFAAGAVRGQPRAGPRARRAPSRLLADLSRAIANVPAH
jgi:hypothetical protein